MKIVINRCYGGFSISPKAIKRLAELNGRECYFFTHDRHDYTIYIPVPLEKINRNSYVTAFDISNPNNTHDTDSHYLTSCPDDRTDSKLIQVIEELGNEANGDCAELHILEIPDNIDYEIEEYDGKEWVAEKHNTWS